MNYYAHGKAVLVFKTADEAIFDESKTLIEKYLGYEEFDCEIGEKEITVYAWGYEKYSKFYTNRMLKKLQSIESIEDGSEIEFRNYDDKLWRFIFENGAWKHQLGDIVYHDIN